MSLKTDKKSIETLAISYGAEELSLVAEFYDRSQRLTVWEYASDIETIRKAISLHTQNLFYVFHAEDEWSDSTGLHMYKRLWDSMNIIYGVSHAPAMIESVVTYLQKREVNQILTWNIHWKFLDIQSEVDVHSKEDYETAEKEWYDLDNWIISKSILHEDEIETFEEGGIQVEVLKILI